MLIVLVPKQQHHQKRSTNISIQGHKGDKHHGEQPVDTKISGWICLGVKAGLCSERGNRVGQLKSIPNYRNIKRRDITV